jgi:hypothetical protein
MIAEHVPGTKLCKENGPSLHLSRPHHLDTPFREDIHVLLLFAEVNNFTSGFLIHDLAEKHKLFDLKHTHPFKYGCILDFPCQLQAGYIGEVDELRTAWRLYQAVPTWRWRSPHRSELGVAAAHRPGAPIRGWNYPTGLSLCS